MSYSCNCGTASYRFLSANYTFRKPQRLRAGANRFLWKAGLGVKMIPHGNSGGNPARSVVKLPDPAELSLNARYDTSR